LQFELAGNLLRGVSGGIDKTRAQRIMPSHELIDALLQRRKSQCSDQAHATGNVVSRRVRLKLIDEPQSFLCKRQRVPPAAGHTWDLLLGSRLRFLLQHQQQ
jgi:hypothetical protein